MPALASAVPFFTAPSGSSASTTVYPARAKCSPSTWRTSASSSTSRIVRKASAADAAQPAAATAGGVDGYRGEASAFSGSVRAGSPAAGRGRRRRRARRQRRRREMRRRQGGGGARQRRRLGARQRRRPSSSARPASMSVSAAANDASTAAVESRRSSSMPRARSSSSSWALIPWLSSSNSMSRSATSNGTWSVRLKLNRPSRMRMSCSSAISMRPRRMTSRFSGGRARARGSSGGVSQVNAATTKPCVEHDRAVADLGLDGEEPGLLAEGDDLEDVEEGQVLEVPGEAHGIAWWTVIINGASLHRGQDLIRHAVEGDDARPRPPPRRPPWACRR